MINQERRPSVTELFIILALLLAVVLTVIYVYLVASVYPWLTLHLTWRKRYPYTDRGLLRVRFPEGRGVVYEPDPRVRRYVSKYALFTSEGKKYIRLRVDKRINYLRYDVVTFDRRGRLLDVLEVSERLSSAGSPRAVRLPAATAYASVLPRQVDGEYTGKDLAVVYSPIGIAVFTALTVLTTVFIAFLIRNEIPSLLYYGDEFLASPPAGKTFILSVVLGAVNALWVVLMHYLHAIRKINR
jgi:hypothetical protein